MFFALRQAGAIIRRDFERPIAVSFKNKSRINLVTKTDQAADRLIRRILMKAFPAHDLLTEESIPTGKNRPINGSLIRWMEPRTMPIIFPQWAYPSPGISRGHCSRRRLRSVPRRTILGRERSRGAADPCWPRDTHFCLSHVFSLPLTLIDRFSLRPARADRPLPDVCEGLHEAYSGYSPRRRGGLGPLLGGLGRVDGYWEWRLKPWDVAAGVLIVTEAGGRVSDFSGKRFSTYGEQTLATNGRIHPAILREMKALPR